MAFQPLSRSSTHLIQIIDEPYWCIQSVFLSRDKRCSVPWDSSRAVRYPSLYKENNGYTRRWKPCNTCGERRGSLSAEDFDAIENPSTDLAHPPQRTRGPLNPLCSELRCGASLQCQTYPGALGFRYTRSYTRSII